MRSFTGPFAQALFLQHMFAAEVDKPFHRFEVGALLPDSVQVSGLLNMKVSAALSRTGLAIPYSSWHMGVRWRPTLRHRRFQRRHYDAARCDV